MRLSSQSVRASISELSHPSPPLTPCSAEIPENRRCPLRTTSGPFPLWSSFHCSHCHPKPHIEHWSARTTVLAPCCKAPRQLRNTRLLAESYPTPSLHLCQLHCRCRRELRKWVVPPFVLGRPPFLPHPQPNLDEEHLTRTHHL